MIRLPMPAPILRGFLALLLPGIAVPAAAQTYRVTNDADSGPGSLRASIEAANQAAGPATIRFADGLGTVRLKSALPIISRPVTIDGGSGNAVSGAGAERIFFVDAPGASVAINNLLLMDGMAKGGDGNNGGGGGAGLGGALFVNSGNVTVSGVRFVQNSAVGGSGSVGVSGGGGGLGGSGGTGSAGTILGSSNSGGGGGGGFGGDGGNGGNPGTSHGYAIWAYTSGGGGGGLVGQGAAGQAIPFGSQSFQPGGGGGGGATGPGHLATTTYEARYGSSYPMGGFGSGGAPGGANDGAVGGNGANGGPGGGGGGGSGAAEGANGGMGGSGGGGGGGGNAAIGGNGGAGGFGAGGGGGGNAAQGGSGGAGGFGGGGGGGGGSAEGSNGGQGGYGGGGGAGGHSTGTNANGGAGGFGGGGGAGQRNSTSAGQGGFGGGKGSQGFGDTPAGVGGDGTPAGGGGAGFGGAVFVRADNGAKLQLVNSSIDQGHVAAGRGGITAGDGQAGGSALFLTGGRQEIAVSGGTTQTIAGSIGESVESSLAKLGAGTLILSGNNGGPLGYSGGTTVAGGTLLVDNRAGSGTGSGAVNVLSGAALGGPGTIGGDVAIHNGARLIAGPDTGALSIGGDLKMDPRSLLEMTLGTAWTPLQVADHLLLQGQLDILPGAGFGPGSYTLFDYGTLDGESLRIGQAPAGHSYALFVDAAQHQIDLIVDGPLPVPEPATWLIFALGAAVVYVRRRGRATTSRA